MLFTSAHNGTFVKWHPLSKPTSVGFFVAAGRQRVGEWSTRVRGFGRCFAGAHATRRRRATCSGVPRWNFGDFRGRENPRGCLRPYVFTQLRKGVSLKCR